MGPLWEVGLGYSITDNLQFAVKYRRYSNLEDNRYNTLEMDSNYYRATLSYRFGSASKQAPVAAPNAAQDGVPNNVDQCPDTPAQYMVDSNGCTVFEETVQDLYIDAKFANNSAKLNEASIDR
ncbi:MAG: hypothetical protein LPD71_11995 [Shewanella sp.]|nr:hypothetical protein [Shewanella sp.]MCF1430983.1 hypothetical protein [Shewanella sp.]MCF1439428.1 hypothetical protein [Shewanella sp.]MCF1459376.1 hypothetical protein [Shewanella sp.]